MFESIRVVEIALMAEMKLYVGEIPIVEIKGKKGGIQLVGEFMCEGGFAGAGTARDADDDGRGGMLRGL